MVNSSVVCDAALFHPFFWNDWKAANFSEAIRKISTKDDFKSQSEYSQTISEAVATFVSLVSVYGFVL
jgi:hypothetical protein